MISGDIWCYKIHIKSWKQQQMSLEKTSTYYNSKMFIEGTFLVIASHSSEIRGLHSMKSLIIFFYILCIRKTFSIFFHFMKLCIFTKLMSICMKWKKGKKLYIKYSKFWSILLEHFIGINLLLFMKSAIILCLWVVY